MTLLYDWLKKAAKAQGNNKAVVYRDNYLSWRGLLHRVDRRAQEFKSMGIKEGAWVGLMLGNVPDFVILALALSRLDAAIVPIDPTTGGRELDLILADSLGDPKALLRTDTPTIAAVDPAIGAPAMTDQTKILGAVPLSHSYRWDFGFRPTLKLGSTMFLEEEISARRIGKLVREHEID